MVTTNSGSARLVNAAMLKAGAVNTGMASSNVTAAPLNWPRTTT